MRGPSFIKTFQSMCEVVLDLPDIKNSLIFCLKTKEKGELHAFFLSNSKSIPFLNRGGINAKTGSEQGKYQPSYVFFYLFISDDSVDVLDAMITNMVHVIDALARFGVLQFGQGGQFSADLSAALLHCEATVDRTRNWRLQVRNDLNWLVDG